VAPIVSFSSPSRASPAVLPLSVLKELAGWRNCRILRGRKLHAGVRDLAPQLPCDSTGFCGDILSHWRVRSKRVCDGEGEVTGQVQLREQESRVWLGVASAWNNSCAGILDASPCIGKDDCTSGVSYGFDSPEKRRDLL
jgi:hypothetical protein